MGGRARRSCREPRRAAARLVFTAHSLPRALAAACDYEAELRETAALVAFPLGRQDYSLVYQSRSGPPGQPWLEPDIVEHLRALAQAGRARRRGRADRLPVRPHGGGLRPRPRGAGRERSSWGCNMVRAATVGTHPRFVRMIRELVVERIEG